MVRQRHSGRAHGVVSTTFRDGATRSPANESRTSLSAERSQSGSRTRRAEQTQRQNHSRIRVNSQSWGMTALRPFSANGASFIESLGQRPRTLGMRMPALKARFTYDAG